MHVSLRPLAGAIIIVVALSLSVSRAPGFVEAAPLNRPADPVVLTGAALPAFVSASVPPGDILAFRYDTAWVQIPVQADERRMQDYRVIYNNNIPAGFSNLVYADAGTFTGADPNPALDNDDEVVFMAKDAGNAASGFSEPPGVVSGSGLEVRVTDPLDASAEGYVYLFRRSGSLDPGAGAQYVTYNFNLLSGAYKTTYNLPDGPNPENSTITSPYYGRHFGDRWQDDELNVFTGGANGDDILDRHKALFAPGNCVRSEFTFNDAEGAFIINKSGPVRAIRSYIGANSGPLTQRDHIYYERREDLNTYLRVHTIGSILDFFDYSPAATGMTYYNNLNTGGVTIDGMPELPAGGAPSWEMVTGPEGSVTIANSYSVNNPPTGFAPTLYYLDDSTPPVTQCTGDAFAYGSSGTYVNHQINCTDPLINSPECATNYFRGFRTLYFDAPGAGVAQAQLRDSEAKTPLQYNVTAYVPDVDADGIPYASDNCPTVANPAQTDTDNDALGDDCEATYSVDLNDPDTDGDGCRDGVEVRAGTFTPAQGGDRDPAAPWDFFDVPVPALLPSNTSGVRNGAIGIQDVLAVVAYIGTVDNAGANMQGADYDSDLNGNGIEDGAEHDRLPSAVSGKPWRSGAPSGSVSINDALVGLLQIGSVCT